MINSMNGGDGLRFNKGLYSAYQKYASYRNPLPGLGNGGGGGNVSNEKWENAKASLGERARDLYTEAYGLTKLADKYKIGETVGTPVTTVTALADSSAFKVRALEGAKAESFSFSVDRMTAAVWEMASYNGGDSWVDAVNGGALWSEQGKLAFSFDLDAAKNFEVDLDALGVASMNMYEALHAISDEINRVADAKGLVVDTEVHFNQEVNGEYYYNIQISSKEGNFTLSDTFNRGTAFATETQSSQYVYTVDGTEYFSDDAIVVHNNIEIDFTGYQPHSRIETSVSLEVGNVYRNDFSDPETLSDLNVVYGNNYRVGTDKKLHTSNFLATIGATSDYSQERTISANFTFDNNNSYGGLVLVDNGIDYLDITFGTNADYLGFYYDNADEGLEYTTHDVFNFTQGVTYQVEATIDALGNLTATVRDEVGNQLFQTNYSLSAMSGGAADLSLTKYGGMGLLTGGAVTIDDLVTKDNQSINGFDVRVSGDSTKIVQKRFDNGDLTNITFDGSNYSVANNQLVMDSSSQTHSIAYLDETAHYSNSRKINADILFQDDNASAGFVLNDSSNGYLEVKGSTSGDYLSFHYHDKVTGQLYSDAISFNFQSGINYKFESTSNENGELTVRIMDESGVELVSHQTTLQALTGSNRDLDGTMGVIATESVVKFDNIDARDTKTSVQFSVDSINIGSAGSGSVRSYSYAGVGTYQTEVNGGFGGNSGHFRFDFADTSKDFIVDVSMLMIESKRTDLALTTIAKEIEKQAALVGAGVTAKVVYDKDIFGANGYMLEISSTEDVNIGGMGAPYSLGLDGMLYASDPVDTTYNYTVDGVQYTTATDSTIVYHDGFYIDFANALPTYNSATGEWLTSSTTLSVVENEVLIWSPVSKDNSGENMWTSSVDVDYLLSDHTFSSAINKGKYQLTFQARSEAEGELNVYTTERYALNPYINLTSEWQTFTYEFETLSDMNLFFHDNGGAGEIFIKDIFLENISDANIISQEVTTTPSGENSGGTQDLTETYNQIVAFTAEYNNLLMFLKSDEAVGYVKETLIKQIENMYAKNKNLLTSIGIDRARDGVLEVNDRTLNDALYNDFANVKEAFTYGSKNIGTLLKNITFEISKDVISFMNPYEGGGSGGTSFTPPTRNLSFPGFASPGGNTNMYTGSSFNSYY